MATRGARQRRGHFRAALEDLLAAAAGRYETLVLTTQHPEYFELFGFWVLPENVFVRRLDHHRPRGRPARRLDPFDDVDRGLLHRLLGARAPVSEVLGIGPERSVWAFYEAGATVLMCHGPFPGGDRPRMLPRAGRC